MSGDLEEAVEIIEWEHFQEPYDGRLFLYFNGEMVRLSYRIGLHMRKPMEVVMGKGDYLKLRAAPQFAEYKLEKLDPENVDKCLYKETYAFAPNMPQTINTHKWWHPKYSKSNGLTAQTMQAQLLAQQTQLQQMKAQYMQGLQQQQAIPPGSHLWSSAQSPAHQIWSSNNTAGGMDHGIAQSCGMGHTLKDWLLGDPGI